jgi:hypothetical protein
VDDGTWHHLTFVWTGSTLNYYADGVLIGARFVGTATEEADQRIIIGARTNGEGFRLTGAVGDVLFFDRALSTDEITKIYQWRTME